MNTALQPAPTSDDLERFERYYLISPSGALHFNLAGKSRLGPWFARHGFSLQACRTIEQLNSTLRAVLADDLAQAREQMQGLLASGDCSPAERDALTTLLSRHRLAE